MYLESTDNFKLCEILAPIDTLCKSPEIQCVEAAFPHHFVTFYPTTILLTSDALKIVPNTVVKQY